MSPHEPFLTWKLEKGSRFLSHCEEFTFCTGPNCREEDEEGGGGGEEGLHTLLQKSIDERVLTMTAQKNLRKWQAWTNLRQI